MATSQLSEKYVVVKYNQKVEEYISNKNMAMPTVWGTDVELFCAAIWLKTDIHSPTRSIRTDTNFTNVFTHLSIYHSKYTLYKVSTR